MASRSVNFKFPLDASQFIETDFEVLDSLGNIYTPSCVSLAPANENGENRTVLLLGEFGTAVIQQIHLLKLVFVDGDNFYSTDIPYLESLLVQKS